MPAMPMALSSAPMVVGIRQTSSATSTVRLTEVPTAPACGLRHITTIRKMMVSELSSTSRAISFGVF